MSRQKSLPYMRWFVTDYRASRNANRLTWQERGIYRELLDECWVEGSIPDDVAQLADIARCPVAVMKKAWPNIRPLFTESGDAHLVNRRLEIERSADDAERVRKAMSGRMGGLAKASGARNRLAGASGPLASSKEQLEQSKAVQALAGASPNGATPPCADCHYPSGDHALTCPQVANWRTAVNAAADKRRVS